MLTRDKIVIALAIVLGAVVPDAAALVALLELPEPVSRAICSAVLALATAYGIKPQVKPTSGSQAGYVRRSLVLALGIVTLVGGIACAVLQKAKDDPGAASREALKHAELACLGCRVPDLPKEAQAACAKLEPVCAGLAGICEDATQ
jgi:hypothetical protein